MFDFISSGSSNAYIIFLAIVNIFSSLATLNTDALGVDILGIGVFSIGVFGIDIFKFLLILKMNLLFFSSLGLTSIILSSKLVLTKDFPSKTISESIAVPILNLLYSGVI
ncbi:MAG: hypothetical protein BWY04_00451 [candidate division CPR1 bacterium ADurb.Bin160]|uniref:Uncharacterized protein n=1 Tax=candidate division CPR1 bacterium ADurb.Bin160 TaxID=1852826 RepID=A0A1V5ZQ25_9BACT|nr:MAG: hypothetical protein BWY04_00451 [candidate division CPR1 bacterium ADurb.Bin160]